jgi:hypothetical protein
MRYSMPNPQSVLALTQVIVLGLALARFLLPVLPNELLVAAPEAPLNIGDPNFLWVERQGSNAVVHYYEPLRKLQRAPTLTGPWITIDSPSPFVEAVSSAPVRYFRVIDR